MENYSTLLEMPMDKVIYKVVTAYDDDVLLTNNIASDALNLSDLLRGTKWWKSFNGNNYDIHRALIKMAYEIEYIWSAPEWDDGYFETYEGFLSMIEIDINKED